MKIKVYRSRFLVGKYTYPLNIEVFEGETKIGYFDYRYYTIGLNKKLIFSAKNSVLKDILRHELTHYLVAIHHGPLVKPHGEEFKKMCLNYGYNEDSVIKSKMNLDLANQSKEGELQYEKILNKIQKLINLTQSQNQHESEVATQKANALLIKYNLEEKEIISAKVRENEEFFLKKILTYKRNSTKLYTVQSIIAHFLVYPVLNHGKNEVSLDVVGKKVNVILAETIALFLNDELERLWKIEQKKNPNLKGLRAKNSFFLGIAKGHEEKMKGFKSSCSPRDRKALTIIKDDLKVKASLIFRGFSQTKGSGQILPQAYSLGEEAGSRLKIHTPIDKSPSPSKTFLLDSR